MNVGVIGTGAIGMNVIAALSDGAVSGARVTAVHNRTPKRAHEVVASLDTGHEVVVAPGPTAVCERADVVVEAAGQRVVERSAVEILETGTDLLVMSVGAFRDPALLADVKRAAVGANARVRVPSGAIAGIDGVRAIGNGRLDRVSLRCYRPPAYLEPYLDAGRTPDDLADGEVIFDGTAVQAAAAYPGHMNVAIALTLAAAVAPEDVSVRIAVDTDAPRSRYVVTAEGEIGAVTAEIANYRTRGTPETSTLTVQSVVETIRRLSERVTVGT